jgi:peptidoglycan hydrolase-like protein with peptidoglycan-binding domain
VGENGSLGTKTLELINSLVSVNSVTENLTTPATQSSDSPVPKAIIKDAKSLVPSTEKINKDSRVGMVGDNVRTLQKFLNANGYIITESGPGSVGNETSYFGLLTKKALQKFQTDYNISDKTGAMDAATRDFISSITSPATAPVESAVSAESTNDESVEANPDKISTSVSLQFDRALSRGMSGEDVSRLQELLSLLPDIYPEKLVTGYYGESTERAVQRLQVGYSVLATEDDPSVGIFGKRSVASLQNLFVNK